MVSGEFQADRVTRDSLVIQVLLEHQAKSATQVRLEQPASREVRVRRVRLEQLDQLGTLDVRASKEFVVRTVTRGHLGLQEARVALVSKECRVQGAELVSLELPVNPVHKDKAVQLVRRVLLVNRDPEDCLV